ERADLSVVGSVKHLTDCSAGESYHRTHTPAPLKGEPRDPRIHPRPVDPRGLRTDAAPRRHGHPAAPRTGARPARAAPHEPPRGRLMGRRRSQPAEKVAART